MHDILPTIQQWTRDERPFVLARVVATWGSAPRRVGSAMAVTSDSEFVGSVSGGCVEAAVIEQAEEVLQIREPRLLEFGVEDERAWSVGLSCGGRIKILLECFPAFSDDVAEREVGAAWLDLLQRGESGVVVSWFGDPSLGHSLVLPDGSILGAFPAPAVMSVETALSCLERHASELTTLADRDVFLHALHAREKLIIIGATDIATHLVRLATDFEFETVVIDPRPVFADPDRFKPRPDQILSVWPDEALANLSITTGTYAVLLSHNPKIDDPALRRLLRSQVRYIGALGSRKTQDDRRQRLIASGFAQEEIDRIKGPVGLNIGASSPAEIALSIMAEIVAVRNGCAAPFFPMHA